MVKLQEAENQIVIAYEVYDQRPSDSDLLIAAIETHQAALGCTPKLLAADAGFYSAKNEAAAKAKSPPSGRQARLHPQSLHQEPGAQTRAKEALVPQRPEMADRLRGSHQRGQATARTESQPIQELPRRSRGRPGMQRWVGLGVIADNLVNISRVIAKQPSQ